MYLYIRTSATVYFSLSIIYIIKIRSDTSRPGNPIHAATRSPNWDPAVSDSSSPSGTAVPRRLPLIRSTARPSGRDSPGHTLRPILGLGRPCPTLRPIQGAREAIPRGRGARGGKRVVSQIPPLSSVFSAPLQPTFSWPSDSV